MVYALEVLHLRLHLLTEELKHRRSAPHASSNEAAPFNIDRKPRTVEVSG